MKGKGKKIYTNKQTKLSLPVAKNQAIIVSIINSANIQIIAHKTAKIFYYKAIEYRTNKLDYSRQNPGTRTLIP